MIAGIYKIHIKEINIKNRVYCYYFDNLIRAKKLETKNILIGEKNYKNLEIYFTRCLQQVNKNIKSALS